MKRFLFALSFALVAENAAAQAPPPAQKALLKGDWQAPNDASDIIHVSEKLPAKPAANGTALVIADHSCGGTDLGDNAISTKPDGSWYLEDADGECSVVVSVSATKLEISPVGGRGNTNTYKRRPAPVRKK